MRANVRREGAAAVVSLSGKITIAGGDEELEDLLLDLLESDPSRIVLDLRRVGYVDSSGLGSLVACQKAAVERGTELILVGPTAKVLDLLRLTGLADKFRICEEESEALAVP